MGSARAISWCSTMADAPRMDHKQLRRAKKLIRKLCCNYDHGNCLALDDGEYEGRAAFAVLSFAMIRRLLLVHFALHGSVVLADLIEIARQYSAEIEYSDENVEILLYRIQEVL